MDQKPNHIQSGLYKRARNLEWTARENTVVSAKENARKGTAWMVPKTTDTSVEVKGKPKFIVW